MEPNEASVGLKQATTNLDKKIEGVKSTQDAATAIAADHAKACAERDRLNELRTLTASQLLQMENARRLVLKLEGDGKVAEAAVKAAEDARAAAELDVAIARRQDAFAELANLSDAFVNGVKAAEATLRPLLDAFRSKLAEVAGYDKELEPYVEFDRTPWDLPASAAKPDMPVLAAAQAVLDSEEREKWLAEEAARPPEPEPERLPEYRVPRNEWGVWDHPTRPDPGVDANGG